MCIFFGRYFNRRVNLVLLLKFTMFSSWADGVLLRSVPIVAWWVVSGCTFTCERSASFCTRLKNQHRSLFKMWEWTAVRCCGWTWFLCQGLSWNGMQLMDRGKEEKVLKRRDCGTLPSTEDKRQITNCTSVHRWFVKPVFKHQSFW